MDTVEDKLNSKIRKTYTYEDVSSKTFASYNFEDDYSFNLDANRNPILDGLGAAGAEAQSVMDQDWYTHAEIAYLLLKTVKNDEGFTTQYVYSSYDQSWSIHGSLKDQEYYRGTTNLYMDQNIATYVSYHKVLNVYYQYTDQGGNVKLLQEEVNEGYNLGGRKNEVWPRSKTLESSSDLAGIRLAGSNDYRRGDFLVTGTVLYYRGDINGTLSPVGQTTFYKVNNQGKNLKFLEEHEVRNENAGDTFQDGDSIYRSARNESTTYYYEGNNIKPKYVFNSIDKIESEPGAKPKDVRDFILGRTNVIPGNLENYGTLEEYRYDDNGNVIYTEDALGNKVETKYEGPYHQVSQSKQTSADGLSINESNYEYNTSDGMLKKNTTAIKYFDPELSTSKTDTVIKEITSYNTYKQPLQVKESSTGDQFSLNSFITIHDYSYDAKSLHIEEEETFAKLGAGATAQTTINSQYYYDSYDRLNQQIYADGSKAEYSYDFKNRMTLQKYLPGPNNPGAALTTTYSYDDLNRKTTETSPNNEKVVSYYSGYGDLEKLSKIVNGVEKIISINLTDVTGGLVTTTLPYGIEDQKTSYTYGSSGVQTVTNPIGETTKTIYWNEYQNQDNSMNYRQNTSKVITPDGKSTTTFYNKVGNAIRIIESSKTDLRTTEYKYSTTGQLLETKVSSQGKSQTTKYKYDGFGNLIYVENAVGDKYRYVYNSLGQVVSIYINGKVQNIKTYNELGWLLSKTDTSGQQETYSYNKNGLVNTIKDRNKNETSYTYTPYNEIDEETITNPMGSILSLQNYTYDPLTRKLLSSSNNEDANITYHYDGWGRMDQQTISGKVYSFDYDKFDRLYHLIYPDGKKVEYTYDNVNRMKSVTYPDMGTVNYQYETGDNANKYTISYPNQSQQVRITDAFGQLDSMSQKKTDSSNTEFWNEQFGFDGFGNIQTITRNAVTTYNFTYDNLNRIQTEKLPDGDISYQYDDKGNRTLKSGGSSNIPDSSIVSYSYNVKNQLKTFTKDNKVAQYTYYNDGLRASKKVGTDTTRYVYLNGKVIEELDDKGNVKARNIWGNELLYRENVSPNAAGFYYYNGHGDVISIRGFTGQVLNSYDYDIWGNLLSSTETMNNPFKYSGEIYDEESGLYYLRARYYEPSVGRFINEDTYEGEINNPLSLNLYTYVSNNPMRYTDPNGHRQCEGGNTCDADPVSCNCYKRVDQMSNAELMDILSDPNASKDVKDQVNMYLFAHNAISLATATELKVAKSIGKLVLWFKGSGEIQEAAGSFMLSKGNLGHVWKGHSYGKIKEQMAHWVKFKSYSEIEDQLQGISFFNPKLTMEQVGNIVEKAANQALNNGITDGKFTTKIKGETVTVAFEEGVFQSAWGSYKFKMSDFGYF